MTFNNLSQIIVFIGGLFACLLGLVAVLRQFAVKPLVKYLQLNVIDPLTAKLKEIEDSLEASIEKQADRVDAIEASLKAHILHANLRADFATKERQLMMTFMGLKVTDPHEERSEDAASRGL